MCNYSQCCIVITLNLQSHESNAKEQSVYYLGVTTMKFLLQWSQSYKMRTTVMANPQDNA